MISIKAAIFYVSTSFELYYILQKRIQKVFLVGSSGLMVMEGDPCSRVREFESHQWMMVNCSQFCDVKLYENV